MSLIRKHIGGLIKRTFYRAPYIKYCTQTIYKSLQGCVRLARYTGDKKWYRNADMLAQILINRQLKDGGFDVGYNYSYGKNIYHLKGFSHSSETTALIAIAEYNRLTGKGYPEELKKGIAWINNNIRHIDTGQFAIPYDPHNSDEIGIFNATSFSSSAIGCSLDMLNNQNELLPVYTGMIKYLDNVMMKDGNNPGRLWYYYDKSWKGVIEKMKNKIDYYHQMQQVEAHSLANMIYPDQTQEKIIRDAADHIVFVHQKNKLLPYDNQNYFNGDIHVWGLSATIPALIEAARVIPERKICYQNIAAQIMEWMLKYAWNGTYFYDLLTPEGKPLSTDYMVRSDSYCFHALATYTMEFGDGPWYDIALKCFNKMEEVDFSGYEKHGIKLIQMLIQRFENQNEAIN